MEVGSETGTLSSREPLTVGIQKSTVTQTQPPMQNMRLAFTSDGNAIYKPVTTGSPPYQGSGGGGGGSTEVASDSLPQPIASHGLNMNIGEPLKRKRGRPRKYGPDGSMALGFSPVPPSSAVPPVSSGFPSPPVGSVNPALSSPSAMKKAKGRPLGSGKKKQMAALGSAGSGFIPHVITVKAGEDVSSKIMSFLQCGPRAVCILSANGAISNVTLRQAATSGGTVTYEGRFEILSLSGSFLLSESGGQRSRTGGLSVSLAGPDGRVLGGGVAGLLTAASPVQVVVGSFNADGQKEYKHQPNLSEASSGSRLPPPRIAGPGSPPSHGTLSESSGGPGSPTNHSSGACINSNQQGMSSMPWK